MSAKTWRSIRILTATAVLVSSMALPALADGPQYGDVIGPVTATSIGLKMPPSKEIYDGLTASQRSYLEQQIYTRRAEVERLIRAGEISVHVIAVGSAPKTQSASAGKFFMPDYTHVYVEYKCMIAAADTVDGSWMNGGGSTNSFGVGMYDIRVYGDFYRAGNYQNSFAGGCLNCNPPSSYAEAWGGSIWKWWWDHPEWVTQSYHYAESSQFHWDLGPAQYCYISRVY